AATSPGPPSRSPSAASAPSAHTPPAPCAPAASHLPLPATAQPRSVPLPSSCSTPPDSCSPLHPPAPPPPLLPLHLVPAPPPRSLPTRSGTLAPSPVGHSAQQIRCSHSLTTAPGPPSCIPVLPLPAKTHPPQIALPSAPASSNNLPPLPPLRCESHPPLPPALALPVHPECRSAHSRLVVLSADRSPPPLHRIRTTSPILWLPL